MAGAMRGLEEIALERPVVQHQSRVVEQVLGTPISGG